VNPPGTCADHQNHRRKHPRPDSEVLKDAVAAATAARSPSTARRKNAIALATRITVSPSG
ncbi:MAG TPA: hypothetical protein PLP66_08615, partial [Phycisphaerae bacterium]|nr:hypothetical protein [Phycisphaerae bacterium]